MEELLEDMKIKPNATYQSREGPQYCERIIFENMDDLKYLDTMLNTKNN